MKLVGNLWILWKTQDSRLWNLWITPRAALSVSDPFAIVAPLQEPVHNWPAHLEINRLSAHINPLSARVTLTVLRGLSPKEEPEGNALGAGAVSTLSEAALGSFPHHSLGF
jgi:hypothetical protein